MKKTPLHYIITTILTVIGLIAFCVMVSEPAEGHKFTVLPNLIAMGVIWAEIKLAEWLEKNNIIQTDLFDDETV